MRKRSQCAKERDRTRLAKEHDSSRVVASHGAYASQLVLAAPQTSYSLQPLVPWRRPPRGRGAPPRAAAWGFAPCGGGDGAARSHRAGAEPEAAVPRINAAMVEPPPGKKEADREGGGAAENGGGGRGRRGRRRPRPRRPLRA
jgi:hypothetical protein